MLPRSHRSTKAKECMPPTCQNTKSGRAAVFPSGGWNPAPACLQAVERRVGQQLLSRPCAFRRACIQMPASFACFSCLALLKSVVFLGPLGELGVKPPWSSLPLWLPLEGFAEMIAPKLGGFLTPQQELGLLRGRGVKKRHSESRPSCASLQNRGFPQAPGGIGPFAWEGC